MDIVELDKVITLAINALNSPWSDAFWKYITKTQLWFPMYGFIAGLIVWRLGWKKGLIFTACLILMITCSDQLCNLVKHAVGRVRPCRDEWMIEHGLHILKKSKSFSFFSAHAANCFGFAWTSLIAFKQDSRLKYRGYAAFIFTWASLVTLSRVFVGMHFFGDILVGSIVGSAIGIAFGYLGKYGCSHYIR